MEMPATITSKANARVKALRAAFSGKASRPGELVGIEGSTLIAEAQRSGLEMETVLVREGSESLLSSVAGRAAQRLVLSESVFHSVVDTASPQGIAAVFAIPALRAFEPRANPGVFLFLENIQDPGNLGTLIRSAEAFGVRCLHVTPGTANVWNHKTVRASAGSVFRMRVFTVTVSEFDEAMRQGGIKPVAAVARSSGAVAAYEADLHAPCALMIGNEGAGLSDAALSVARQQVHIPCQVESLNAAVAGSVLLFEAARQNSQLFHPGAV